MAKKRGKKKKKIETPEDKMKYEIAHELGLTDKINKYGWGGLTAKETGRIGGIMTVRKKAMVKELDAKKNKTKEDDMTK